MKKSSLILLTFLFILNSYTQDFSTQNMLMKASKDLPSWLQKIPAGSEILYGFQNRNEFLQAELGTPYPVYTLSNDFFTQPNPALYLKPAGEWRIPIITDLENKALLTVILQNGEWKIVDIGASTLAKEIGDYAKKYSGKQNGTLKIFRVYQLQSDFLFYESPDKSPDKIILIPLHSAYINLDGLNSKTNENRTLSDVIPMIRESISSNKTDR